MATGGKKRKLELPHDLCCDESLEDELSRCKKITRIFFKILSDERKDETLSKRLFDMEQQQQKVIDTLPSTDKYRPGPFGSHGFILFPTDEKPYTLRTCYKVTSLIGTTEQNTREIEFLKKCKHPNICEVLDYSLIHGDIGRGFYLTSLVFKMEHAKCDLFELINKDTLYDSNKLIYQLYNAVKYLHGINIVHCDLKPENILIYESKEGYVLKICDFGISELNKHQHIIHETNSKVTPSYRPLSILLVEEAEAKAKTKAEAKEIPLTLYDIWATNIIMLEILTGADISTKIIWQLRQKNSWKEIYYNNLICLKIEILLETFKDNLNIDEIKKYFTHGGWCLGEHCLIKPKLLFLS